MEHYLQVLLKEMDLAQPAIGKDRPIEQVHLGGGSPSYLSADQLDRLLHRMHELYKITADAELSAELDPRTLSHEKVEILAKHGFRRASFGVQDLNPEVQKAVHRIQPDSMNRECLEWVRAEGFESINIDLIYGLPGQTVDSFRETLNAVLSYDPDRFAVFAYAHVPWVAPVQKILGRMSLPDAETRLEMLTGTIDFLTARGYRYIGMDHFAKENDELTRALDSGTLHRNFQGYSTRSGADLWGFGMSAISQNDEAYHQNFKDLSAYQEAVEKGKLPIHRGYVMSEDDRLRKKVIMTLMCSGRLDFKGMSDQLGIDFKPYFQNEIESLKDLAEDKLIHVDANHMQITEAGRLLIRNVAMRFDAQLQKNENRHAKTI
jgi:oxygen-independent coproporphyrinogen-3 oxidase